MRDFTIPLPGDAVAVLRLPQPMTKNRFEYLRSFIELYEKTLIYEENQDTENLEVT